MDEFGLLPAAALVAMVGSAAALFASFHVRRKPARESRGRLAANVGTAGLAATLLLTPLVTVLTTVPWGFLATVLVLAGAAGVAAATYAVAPFRSSPGSPK